MDPRLIYLFVFAVLFLLAVFFQKKYCFICDATNVVHPKPYSYARLQLVWWTFIVFASFISIALASGQIPTLDYSTLKLLGIGILTTATARIIDISDEASASAAGAAATANLSKNLPSQGFWLDILSDKNGISIHRLQAFVFNLVFGVWFIYRSVVNIGPVNTKSDPLTVINRVIPVITDPNLILLGLSAGAYAALKSTENK